VSAHLLPLWMVLLPLGAAPLLGIGWVRARADVLLVSVAFVEACLGCVVAATAPHGSSAWGYVDVDATARLFLAVVNLIFIGISLYVRNRVTSEAALRSVIGGFTASALVFLGAINAVIVSNHLLAAWIALELSTLAVTPAIVRPGLASRGAAWRYLLFSSVGLGLVLLGFVCLSRSLHVGGASSSLFLDDLARSGLASSNTWGKLGVALVLLGLGTKLGLAPMYSWLPETYDEAPPAVTALLGAIQWNGALVLLFRVVQVFRPAHAELITTELVFMGAASMLVSTFSIIATRNLKRLVAYASINHAGVIAIGLGIGKLASYGLVLYVVSNAFIKAILFLTAGKIKAHYGTKDTREISGLLKKLPYSGVFLMIGTFALLGFPPFGSFFGELLILSALVGSGRMVIFGLFCVLITMTFVATGRTVFPMIWGEPKGDRTWPRQTFLSATPKMVFLLALVVLGVYIPRVVNDLLLEVASSLERQ
jgi:hydrogenase-4 component F